MQNLLHQIISYNYLLTISTFVIQIRQSDNGLSRQILVPSKIGKYKVHTYQDSTIPLKMFFKIP